MQITGANDVDIMLDEDGQPVSDGNGDTALVSDDECWLQDIKNEAMTEEGELFYEDEEGDASYGWSLLDFMQGEYADFTTDTTPPIRNNRNIIARPLSTTIL